MLGAIIIENEDKGLSLIHGSPDGRFKVTYAAGKLSKDEVESVAFNYMPYDEAVAKYDPRKLKTGYNKPADGEEVYFIENPALGLWALLKAD